jgi:repressor LexA
MHGLTQQQQTVYDFIRQQMIARGYGPTVREIGQHMEIKSPHGVMCHLRALEKKGMIRRSANKSRAIELTEPLPRPDWALAVNGTISRAEIRVSQQALRSVDLLASLGTGDQFLLEVSDDSLNSAGIQCGDLMILRKGQQPATGKIILATTAVTGAVAIGHCHAHNGRLLVQPLDTHQAPAIINPQDIIAVATGVLRLWDSNQLTNT